MDPHRFDAEPVPDPKFDFDADPDPEPEPDWCQNDADPFPSFTHVGIFFKFDSHLREFTYVFLISSKSNMS